MFQSADFSDQRQNIPYSLKVNDKHQNIITIKQNSDYLILVLINRYIHIRDGEQNGKRAHASAKALKRQRIEAGGGIRPRAGKSEDSNRTGGNRDAYSITITKATHTQNTVAPSPTLPRF